MTTKELDKLISKVGKDRSTVVKEIFKYLKGCNKKFKKDVEVCYMDEFLQISEIQGSKGLLIEESTSREFDYENFDYDELIDLFYAIKEAMND